MAVDISSGLFAVAAMFPKGRQQRKFCIDTFYNEIKIRDLGFLIDTAICLSEEEISLL